MIIVAEIGAAHGGSLKTALDTIQAAADAGADAIKIQTWTPDEMECGGRILDSGPWKGSSLQALYREAHTPWDWHQPIIDMCGEMGLEWWTTVFDRKALDFAEELGCPRYKIASFELVDIPLLNDVKSTGKPVILSTGMATEDEINRAVAASGDDVTLLKCVSSYPANPKDYNLFTIYDWDIDCKVGLSDHTQSIIAPVVAATLGVEMIERHITLTKGGLDDGFASTPQQFKEMVVAVKTAIESLGDIRYGATPSEAPSLALRRSLWVIRPIRKGERFTLDNIGTRRPADGAPCYLLPDLLGKESGRDYDAGEPLLL